MDAILLALGSAICFGSMTVVLKLALDRPVPPETGAFLTMVFAFAVGLLALLVGGQFEIDGLWPFVAAGALAPGISQLFATAAVRDAGAPRSSVAFGTAPVFAVVLALVLLDEPVVAGLLGGAALVVAGAVVVAFERARPAGFKRIGIAYALVTVLMFSARDTLVRHLALVGDAEPAAAAAVTLGSGAVVLGLVVLVRRRPLALGLAPRWAPVGIVFGLSYVLLFHALYRGRVSVVAPIIATEALWGVVLAALVLRRRELVGWRLLAGAALVVAGGVLIALSR
jgi:drug/metabolite transporter (DMT)-like permease